MSPKGNPFRPPSSLLSIWVPLLESVSANHVHFPATLTLHIIAHLLADNDDSPNEDDRDDAGTTAVIEKTSYDVCLAAWGAWLVEWRHGHGDESDTDVAVRRQDVFFRLIQALSSERKSSSQSRPGCVLSPICKWPTNSIQNKRFCLLIVFFLEQGASATHGPVCLGRAALRNLGHHPGCDAGFRGGP